MSGDVELSEKMKTCV